MAPLLEMTADKILSTYRRKQRREWLLLLALATLAAHSSYLQYKLMHIETEQNKRTPHIEKIKQLQTAYNPQK